MNEDAGLLRCYAAEQSEPAFAEFTRKHVDLVYSAALRMMNGNVHSAQDITQQVFAEAARQAKSLSRHPAVVGWLYTATRLMASRANRSEMRRRVREQEATAMNELLRDDQPAPDWTRLGPVIEDAMHELSEKDRLAVLLRYFQNKTLNEVGAELNLTENAARMRVDRAVDKLRSKLAVRGIATSVVGLTSVITSNAVQAAPASFVATLSTAAIASSTVQMSAFAATTQTIAMTTLQKSIMITALAVATGTGIFAVRQQAQLGGRIQELQEEQAPWAARMQRLEQERTVALSRVAALQQENARLRSEQDAAEVLKLRGQVGALRQQAAAVSAQADSQGSGFAKLMSDPAMKEYIQQAQRDKMRSMFADFFKEMKLSPEQTELVLQALCDHASRGLDRLAAIQAGTGDQWPFDESVQLDQQLRELLGDPGYKRFQTYSHEIPARTTVTLLRDELTEHPLSSEQSVRLLDVVKTEPYDLTQGITGAPDSAFMGSPTEVEQFLQKVSESNQRIIAQSASFLSTNQLETLDRLLTKAIDGRKIQAAAFIPSPGGK